MRITMKGGVWKNSEDEVLKAAVMKYGLQNWSRVASLLVRKSAKQCKARWFNWLDPSVKKTEWSLEEEERLLTLVRLYPTQWRTIAPLVGRTAYQCLEHYEKLLDEAQGKDPTINDPNDPRKIRPGEIDPHPESKPSRADPVDLADDEKEMLSEARARLANARGKKAKRKAREKQLEEARRIASLQKRREMKAAGLPMGKFRTKRNEIDYLKEVPFLQEPPPGPHAVSPQETPKVNFNKANLSLQNIEEERRNETERKFRMEDARRLKRLMAENLPEAILKIKKMNDDPLAFKQRKQLKIPDPQVSEEELQSLLRYGNKNAADIISASRTSSSLASASPSIKETLLSDALAGTFTTTPLPSQLGKDTTPKRGLTGIINSPYVGSFGLGLVDSIDESESLDSTGTQGLKAREALVAMEAKTALQTLPEPIHEVEVTPSFNSPPETNPESPPTDKMPEDEEDRITRSRAKLSEEESEVIKQKLPRPIFVELASFNPDGIFITDKTSETSNPDPYISKQELTQSQDLLLEEMRRLLFLDAIKKPPSAVIKLPKIDFQVEKFTEDELGEAAALFELEVQDISDVYNESYESPTQTTIEEIQQTNSIWDSRLNNWEFLPSKKCFIDTRANSLTARERFEIIKRQYDDIDEIYRRNKKKVEKAAAKYNLKSKGYLELYDILKRKIDSVWNDPSLRREEINVLNEIKMFEEVVIARRLEEVLQKIAEMRCAYSTFQETFQKLKHERDGYLHHLQVQE